MRYAWFWLLIGVLFIGGVLWRWGTTETQRVPGPFNDFGSAAQGTLGVAASVAGAVVAVWLASLANRTLERQNAREADEFCAGVVDGAVLPVLGLASALEALVEEARNIGIRLTDPKIQLVSYLMRGGADPAWLEAVKLLGNPLTRPTQAQLEAELVLVQRAAPSQLHALVSAAQHSANAVGANMYARHLWMVSAASSDPADQHRNADFSRIAAAPNDPAILAVFLGRIADDLSLLARPENDLIRESLLTLSALQSYNFAVEPMAPIRFLNMLSGGVRGVDPK